MILRFHTDWSAQKENLSMVVSSEVIPEATDLTPCRYQEPTQNLDFEMGLFNNFFWCSAKYETVF